LGGVLLGDSSLALFSTSENVITDNSTSDVGVDRLSWIKSRLLSLAEGVLMLQKTSVEADGIFDPVSRQYL